MSRYVFKLPDLGEGTVEAEIVGWRVKVGDVVAEDDVVVEVMTEKAAVEVPAPVNGRVLATTGTPGDMVAVGAELIVIETEAEVAAHLSAPAPKNTVAPDAATQQPVTAAAGIPKLSANRSNGADAHAKSLHAERSSIDGTEGADGNRSGRIATSPAIRRRAHEAGIDLSQLSGSGPNGRILREDLQAFIARRSGAKPGRKPKADSAADIENPTEEIKVIGIRRLIAQRMSEAKRNIPHFAYVEELDVTELEALRRHLNTKLEPGTAALTYLPFIVTALVRVLRDFPQCNALYDAERGVIIRHRAVHVGVATQTSEGLKVPVVRNAQLLSLWDLAAQMRRVTEAARSNKATREELSGSTITITSLGKLGGIVTTPIINAPEVAILGVNRAIERPVVYEGAITIRRMMNLSSSFDHRFVDGFDAAAMIQALKDRLEHPATIFIDP
jgi:2-oxoisovalerate dehydrogenase E2 component (dihydrolipoyl transacylase)